MHWYLNIAKTSGISYGSIPIPHMIYFTCMSPGTPLGANFQQTLSVTWCKLHQIEPPGDGACSCDDTVKIIIIISPILVIQPYKYCTYKCMGFFFLMLRTTVSQPESPSNQCSPRPFWPPPIFHQINLSELYLCYCHTLLNPFTSVTCSNCLPVQPWCSPF